MNEPLKISVDRRVSVLPDVLVREISGESFILNLKTESYFGLDDVGSRMFKLLEESGSVDATLEQLQREYDVDREILRRDLDGLIHDLVSHGLIEFVEPA